MPGPTIVVVFEGNRKRGKLIDQGINSPDLGLRKESLTLIRDRQIPT